MSAKARNILWAVSLIVIGICTLLIVIPNIIGFALPVMLTRISGITELIALPALGFTTVRKLMDKKGAEK